MVDKLIMLLIQTVSRDELVSFTVTTDVTENIRRNSTNLRRICLNNFTITGLEWCSNSTNWNCNPFHKYRSYDGSCNNLRHPGTFGVAFRPFRRAVKAYYADGKSIIRSKFA